MERIAIVAGATGLVGGHLVDELLASNRYARVVVLVRGTFVHRDARVEVRRVDFATLAPDAIPPGTTDAFCALGTTIKIAGSQAAFRKVDFDAVVRFAKAAKAAGVPAFHVVSAMGADADSRVFYNRVKGEMESALASVGFDRVHIARPSLLLGQRTEKRRGEKVGAVILGGLGPFLVGPFAKYRAIHAPTVARAMVAHTEMMTPGVHVHLSDALQRAGTL